MRVDERGQAGTGEPTLPVALLQIAIPPEVIEAGARAFRKWENRFTDPDEAYPFCDGELGEMLAAVFLAMLDSARRIA